MVDSCQTGNLAAHAVSVTVQNEIIIARGAFKHDKNALFRGRGVHSFCSIQAPAWAGA
jgi:hypothetical protein